MSAHYNRIVKPERDTQNRAVPLILDTLPGYRYAGNLEDVENSNIREDVLRKFLVDKQGCSHTEVNDAIRQLKNAAACSTYDALYDKGLETYKMLRNGVSVSRGYGQTNRIVKFIDWSNPANNFYELAEEVTVRRVTEDLKHRRPDIVVYVNGIALVVIELKKVSVSVAEAIRQNRRNQKDEEICHFFTTVQLIMAGNESEGVKYAVTKTPEEFWLKWKEPTGDPCEPSRFSQQQYPNEMMRSLLQLLEPSRLLEIIHDCIIYDGGIKKVARPNQYFALVNSKKRYHANDGGIIWHSQGSGKSLTMVWLAQWIKEQGNDARIVIVTDRDELDKQIENGFKDTGYQPLRVTSGAELITALNTPSGVIVKGKGKSASQADTSIICTLIHKFGGGLHGDNTDNIVVGGKKATRSSEEYMKLIAESLPADFKPKGKVVVFVDECHRTQGGILHQAMKRIMGDDVMMIGFTGTPLMKKSKLTTIEQFGSYIHTYKFDEAVRDGVILDLRYEARNVEQLIDPSDNNSIDQIFEAKTKSMTPRAKKALKEKWATLKRIYSSDKRVSKIVADICKDMILYAPLEQGYGNAMLVAGDIYQAYKYWDAFENTDLKGKTTVVTSYDPAFGIPNGTGGNSGDASVDEEAFKYKTAKRMMGTRSAIEHEEWAKDQFINHPGSMKLLIVVDKLLTGFDAPKATYLYIDKKMEDHNLFQAICRVNRVESDKKEFGYIIDYKDLFNAISSAVEDYTNGAFSGFDSNDVKGLLKNRLEQGKKDLDTALEKLDGICQNVKHPKAVDNYFDYFVFDQATTPPDEQQARSLENSNKRELFYNAVLTVVNRYLAIATQMTEAGYSEEEAKYIHDKVNDFDNLRQAIMLRSGDTTDLKGYNAMMRQLLDQYVQAPRSELLASLEDFSFLDVIDATKSDSDPDGLGALGGVDDALGGEPAAAETMAANARKYMVRKHDANPTYYDKLSERLNKLLEEMKKGTLAYKDTLLQILDIMRELRGNTTQYPDGFNTDGKRALYDNLGNDADLALKTYASIIENAEPGFRENKLRKRKLRQAISQVEGMPSNLVDLILGIAIANSEF